MRSPLQIWLGNYKKIGEFNRDNNRVTFSVSYNQFIYQQISHCKEISMIACCSLSQMEPMFLNNRHRVNTLMSKCKCLVVPGCVKKGPGPVATTSSLNKYSSIYSPVEQFERFNCPEWLLHVLNNTGLFVKSFFCSPTKTL